jgi:hypothetical protein
VQVTIDVLVGPEMMPFWIPALAYRGALAACARALVASKTTSGLGRCPSSQSTPPALVRRPSLLARARPSEAGSTPTM